MSRKKPERPRVAQLNAIFCDIYTDRELRQFLREVFDWLEDELAVEEEADNGK